MAVQVVGLYGPSNCGKSLTLKTLSEKYKKISYNFFSKMSLDGDDENYYLSCPDLDVVITPGGDTAEVIEDNITFFKDCIRKSTAKELVWITASRTKGETVSKIENYSARNRFELHWMAKPYWFPIQEKLKHKFAPEHLTDIYADACSEMLIAFVREITK